jgi:hypothetical protein
MYSISAQIVCRSSDCRRCPWNVKQFNVSSASSQAGPSSAGRIGKRKCASTCRRMRGDVVRLREATTTTFFLEISEPAIAPCPWFRLPKRCENRQETNTVLLCIRKMPSSFSHFCLALARDRLCSVLRHVNFGSHFLCVLVCICGCSRVWI